MKQKIFPGFQVKTTQPGNQTSGPDVRHKEGRILVLFKNSKIDPSLDKEALK
jgi:hypothetical protein